MARILIAELKSSLMPRPPRLVAKVYERWPIESLPLLDDGLRGLYVLYDPDGRPVRVGKAGGGDQDVKSRMMGEYYHSRYWRHVASFSVFTFVSKSMFHQVETIMLRAVGKALAGNVNTGSFSEATTVISPPRQSYDWHFFLRTTGEDGWLKLPSKFEGRKVRVEIGPRRK
jgi:hypothetical protein